jgi:hypothetical protein
LERLQHHLRGPGFFGPFLHVRASVLSGLCQHPFG